MKPILINTYYGGFGLSKVALKMYKEKTGKEYDHDNREDPVIIEVVKLLGKKANGSCSHLGICEIPEDVSYIIQEYDGSERVVEKHRSWTAKTIEYEGNIEVSDNESTDTDSSENNADSSEK